MTTMTAAPSMQSNYSFYRFILAVALMLGVAGCKQNALYERLHNIPEGKWQRTFIPSFAFNISDTTAFYRVYVVVRHTNQYPYRNIWLNVGVQQPQDSMKVQQFELPLAASDKWLGTGMDDVFERRVLLFPRPVKFMHAGEVKFTLQHTMRLDPLPQLLQVGIRVEPVTNAQP
jgi:gliding motility-associated lipoprotein GldH